MDRARDRGRQDVGPSAAAREGAEFDRLARDRGDFNPFTDRGWQTLARSFASARQDAAPARVLDVGCGTGESRRIYADTAARYVGIDVSFGGLSIARRHLTAASWVQADACVLPFATASFQVVAFSSVLHHIADRPAALAEARRVLTPGGFLFAFDPNLLHPAMALFRHPSSPFFRSAGVSSGERPMTARRLRRDIESSGFVGVEQRAQSDIGYRAVAPPLLNRALAAFNALDRLWEACGLGRRFGTFVVSWARVPKAAG